MANDRTHVGQSKVERYKWTTNGKPGRFEMVPKELLEVDHRYQRELDSITEAKVLRVSREWNWVSCGALTVGDRGGQYFVIDGQGRKLAADRRSDVTHLPCIVHVVSEVKEEAKGFIDINQGRNPIKSVDIYKAMLTAGEPIATALDAILTRLGIHVSRNGSASNEVRCVTMLRKICAADPAGLELVLRLCLRIPDPTASVGIRERIIDGLWYIHRFTAGGLEDRRLADRIVAIGHERLLTGANRAAVAFARGGAKRFAIGMMEEINYMLRQRFELLDKAQR